MFIIVMAIQNDTQTITWTDTGVDTAVVPDDDKVLDVREAKTIVLQVNTKHASNTSGDIDVNLIGSVDGTNYCDIPSAEGNFGDGEEGPIFANVEGFQYVKLRADNNEAATTGYITARCNIRNGI